MSTNENRRAGIEARTAVGKSVAPVTRHEVALQHYLAAAAYHGRVEPVRPPVAAESRVEGQAPAVHVPSKTPAPHGKGVPASPAADPGIQLTASRRSDLIVVGVDESPGSARAVDWAAAEAARRHGSLRLVNAVADLTPFGAEGAVYGVTNLDATKMDEHAAMAMGRATSLLDRVAADVRRTHPTLAVTTRLVRDNAAAALRQQSADAGMTVVGSRGAGRLTGVILGSVALTIASDNPAPVAVIHRHDPIDATGPVVVGVDGSAGSEGAIALAIEEAALRNTGLVAVHSWNDFVIDQEFPELPLTVDLEALEQEEYALLSEQLAGWQDKYPDVQIQHNVVRRRPTHALLDASKNAQLLVVGSRGRGGFTGLLLGSTSHALVAHGRCPVIVARQ
jgi:nucleotide-binding universal stress UspA family protein